MKALLTTFALFLAMNAFAFVQDEQNILIKGMPAGLLQDITATDFATMSIGEVETMIGHKLTLKETLAVKAAQKQAKRQIRQFKASNEPAADDDQILLIVLAIFLPPLAVYMYNDEINGQFWLNVVLTLCFGLPGMIHALIVVLS
jgi:uncharacterized membrane protein YqaE (UPF0057 family)